MKSNTIHKLLLESIKSKLPTNNIAEILMDILCIGKEAIYRRLRGTVPFTLSEAATIAFELGISLDDIIGTRSDPNNRPFQLKTTSFVNPSADDYHQMHEWVNILERIVESPDLEIGETGNILDMPLVHPYEHLCTFYHFKWHYQWVGKEEVKRFDEIVIPDEHRDLQIKHSLLYKKIKKTYYIWDYMIFQYTVNDLLYFKNIRLINNEDIIKIKKDLFDLVDYLESIAKEGCFETGNPVQLYISDINSNTTYTYMQCQFFSLSMIKAFSLSALSSTDQKTTNEIKKWVLSQKRQATLISESGEKERIKFFKKQRDIINTLTI